MFTEPKIVTTNDLTARSYVSFYYNGTRCREYNGKKLKLDISPNYAKTIYERNSLLQNLKYEITKALRSGWSPLQNDRLPTVSLKDALMQVLRDKLASNYSSTYKRDLEKLYNQFITLVPKEALQQQPRDISLSTLEDFLKNFKSSNRHYMNKRCTLSVFFAEMVRKGQVATNPIARTLRAKTKSVLHETFTQEEMNYILEYLQHNYANLHLCSLLTYGCFLRPHREIRLLTVNHLHNDFSEIHLSGDENKSGRVRTVFVPIYIQVILKKRLEDFSIKGTNIFTLTSQPFNDDYFKTQWSRAKKEMAELSLISERQTLYSFRHTGAVNVYRKTKDLHIIQQLLGHSDMIVTMNYLRGLGVTNNEHLRSVLPEI